ncbi:MAG: DUF3179 domain-containing (seleno)protein [Ardenticatenaceae bacterium]
MKNGLFTLLCLLFVVACTPSAENTSPAPTASATSALAFEVLLPPNAIQVLDNPATVTASEAANHIGAYDEVMGITVEGQARAYPIGLMSRYEIANDTLGGQPVTVTFCAHCNTGVAFSRRVEDEAGAMSELSFEVSGQFLDNAMVMIDRETGTLWAQSRLEGVDGPLTGKKLKLLVANQTPWEEWAAANPDTTLVIDEQAPPVEASTSFELPALPAAGSSSAPTEAVADYVIGISSETAAWAFPIEHIEKVGVINEQLDGLSPFALVALGEPGAIAAWQRTHEGQTLTFVQEGQTLKDQETGSTWDPHTGVAQEGPLAGAQLEPFPTWLTHWLGWVDLYPSTTLFKE